MSAGRLALSFVERFCAGDLRGLSQLLDPGLNFTGPQLECRAAQDYMQALQHNPPVAASFDVLSLREDGETVSLRWLYRKSPKPILVNQRFRVRDGKIVLIRLDYRRYNNVT